MRKYLNRIICFALALGLMATSSFVDFSTTYGISTISEAVKTAETGIDLGKDVETVTGLFNVTGLNKEAFASQSEYFRTSSAYAADEDSGSATEYSVAGFSDIEGAFPKAGSTSKLRSSYKIITLTQRVDGEYKDFPEDVSVKFFSSNPDVIEICDIDSTPMSDPAVYEADDESDPSCMLIRRGPGTTTIQCIFKYEEKQVVFQFDVQVEFSVDKTSDDWRNPSSTISGEATKILVLDQADFLDDPAMNYGDPYADDYAGNQFYSLAIKYMDMASSTANVDSLIVKETNDYNDTVVKYYKGKLRVMGAGFTHVTLTTETDGQTSDFYVLVKPRGSFEEPDKYWIKDGEPELVDLVKQSVSGTASFTLYTNAVKASTLNWEVARYDASSGGDHYVKVVDNKYITYSISENSGVVNFSYAKAGTYRIVAKCKDSYTSDYNILTYYVTILPTLQSAVIYINVGDTYDIIQNSNIPAAEFNKLYNMSTVDEDGMFSGDFIKLDQAKGIITGVKIGVGKVRVKFRTGTIDTTSIFDSSVMDASGLTGEVIITVNVIDSISISNSILSNGNSPTYTIYMGEEYPLFANVTNKDFDIYWESADPSVATIEENGYGCAIVKGVKPGTVTVRAYQIIDGVEKNAYATIIVKKTITKITLDPSEVEMAVGEYKTIVAKFEGDPSDLIWMTSDPTVFSFAEDEGNGTSVIIQGLKPGKALLTAINKDNIVCGYCQVTVLQEATGLKLSESSLTLYESSGNHQLYAYITPSDAYDSTVTWTSTNTKVVTVDQNGLLTVHQAGEATIVVQSKLNPELIAYCNVTVLKSVKSIAFDEDNIEMYKGETYRLAYVIKPEGASNTAISVTSFNPSVATATASTDGSIIIKAVNTGNTQIMIMTTDGNYYDIVNITVRQKATGVKMVYTDVYLGIGEFFDLEVQITPADATDRSLIWESLTPAVATVSTSGRVQGISAGDAIVAVRTLGGAVAYANVHVHQNAIGIRLDPEKVKIDSGETIRIDVIFNPPTTTNKDVVWSTSSPDVAVVNEAGMVTGLKGGVAVITCKTVDGGLQAFCLIEVEEPILSIELNPTEYVLGIGKTLQIEAVISNRGTASNLELEWYSDDEYVASVDQTGKVTAMEYGDCIIYCEAVEGDAIATCKIHVVKEVEKIKLNYSVKTIIVGHSFTLKSTVIPEDADFTNVSYKADDNTIVIVDDDGVVTGIKPGSTFVRAEALDNSGKYALCYVTVINEIAATGITVSDAEIYLIPGEHKTVNYTIKPSNTTDNVTWSSSNEEIATVSTSGKITAKSIGTAKITIMAASGKSATVTVHVLGLSRTSIQIPIYTQYSQLVLDGVDPSEVRWDVTDTSICDIQNGVITARKVGTTTVTATYNGRTLSCTVKVTRN